jgi:ADP-ribosylglycohydrolase
MLLGLAVGDALGATSEGKEPRRRRRLHGEIGDYVPGKRSNQRRVGVPTDDTQLTFWTLRQLMADQGLIPDNLARRFCRHHIVGVGTTTKEFLRNYKDRHVSWDRAGLDSLGNGALMRIAPIVVPYLRRPHPSLYADAALDTMITHNAFGNTATCVTFVHLLWCLLGMTKTPEPQWWLDRYCSIASGLEGNTRYRPRSPKHASYEGPLWKFTERVCGDALRKGLTTEEACQGWGSGANLFETVPSVLYILASHANNTEEAIVRAVNDTKDNDTVAAIVGAAVGALHGLDGIPERWVERLTGRTMSDDKGQVFKLILRAKLAFWTNA